jgi:type II secretory pathway pseudopilin PulG
MKNKNIHGFTLVESLVMLLIFAVGMAISVPLFVSAMKDAQTKQCRANMQAIANAEEQYKIKSATVPRQYTTTLTNLIGDFPVVPVCPNGGTYTATISNGTATAQNGQTVPLNRIIISCSFPADGKFAPTIDPQ